MISFIPNRCQPYLYKNAKCRLCADACPIENCVDFKENAVSVDTALCIGCGICANVCPTSALVFENLSDKELWQRLDACIAADDKDVIFGCSLGQKQQSTIPEIASVSPRNGVPKKSQIFWGENDITPNSELFINLPCLAILKESHLISIILSGIKKIYLDAARCNECSFKHGKGIIEKTVSYANNLLNAMGYEDCVKTGVKGQGSGIRKNKKQKIKTITPVPEYSRRELLHFFKTKAVERIIGESDKKEGGKKTENIPERRAILLETLKKLDNNLQITNPVRKSLTSEHKCLDETLYSLPAQKGISFSSPLSNGAKIDAGSFPVNQLIINENCALCHDCSLFCPTGALSRVEGNGEIRIDFNMSFCMGCYECIELCPEGALYREKDIDLAHLFKKEAETLFKKTSNVCPSCNMTFFPEDGLEECIVCSKKKGQDERIFDILFGQQTGV